MNKPNIHHSCLIFFMSEYLLTSYTVIIMRGQRQRGSGAQSLLQTGHRKSYLESKFIANKFSRTAYNTVLVWRDPLQFSVSRTVWAFHGTRQAWNCRAQPEKIRGEQKYFNTFYSNSLIPMKANKTVILFLDPKVTQVLEGYCQKVSMSHFSISHTSFPEQTVQEF